MVEQGAYPEMTPKAAIAFDRYIGMGPKRSIRGLAATLVQESLYKNSASAERVLNTWSSEYQWQSRIAAAATALADARLEQAAEIDAASFLKTSELIADRLRYTTHHHLDEINLMRQAVRKPVVKIGATINVNLNLIVKELAEKYGLTEDEARELHDDVSGHLAASKVGAT